MRSMLSRLHKGVRLPQTNRGLTMIQTIGDRVRKLRKERSLSQEALGDLVGVTKSAINRLENGFTKAPTPETL